MAIDQLVAGQISRGVLVALYGIGFWAAGVVVAHFVWERYRDEGHE